ncbi:MAG TPA: hypothetical protein VFZ59_16155 [Verrucomicrobiae bacterium]|nr:hypothetical protein [Verrucomicrobiae bacterium]
MSAKYWNRLSHERELWQRGLSFGCVSALWILLLTGCDHTLAGKWEYKEIARVASPDTKVEAVLTEGSAGATTSTVTSLYLVPKGGQIGKEDREKSVFDADHLKDFQIVWRESKLLDLQYSEARIFSFRNFWHANEVDSFRYVVEIRLSPASTNSSLPIRDR